MNLLPWKWKTCILLGHDWVKITSWPDITPIPPTHTCRQCDRCGRVQHCLNFDPTFTGRQEWKSGCPPDHLKPKPPLPSALGLRTGLGGCSNPDHNHSLPRVAPEPSEWLEHGLTAQERGTLG